MDPSSFRTRNSRAKQRNAWAYPLALRGAERGTLIAPEIPERPRRQLDVSDGMPDVAVSQIVLDRSGVMTVAGQFVPGAVSQHVGMDLER
jgi:hypothetical protein